ncbi:MAG TPA: DUF748 domain-containing protein, partial [Gammaproteobacteria bacterium]|nr:DUF748 domain-containing protein [Gammaproteobacteria bacterium]
VNPFNLSVQLVGPELVEPEAGLSFSARRVVLNFNFATLFTHEIVLDELSIERPRMQADFSGRRQSDTGYTLGARIRAALQDSRPFEMRRLHVQNGQLLFIDARAADKNLSFAGVSIAGSDLTNIAPSPGHYSVTAEAVQVGNRSAASLELAGDLSLQSLKASGQTALSGLPLEPLRPWLGTRLARTAASGVLDFSTHFSYSPPAANRLSDSGQVELTGGRLELAGASWTPERTFEAKNVAGALSAAGFDLKAALPKGASGALSLRLGQPRTGARSVELTLEHLPAETLAPYAARALGRSLTAGDADLTVDFSRQGSRIDGELRIRGRGLAFAAAAPDVSAEAIPGGGTDGASSKETASSGAPPAPPPEPSREAGLRLDFALALLRDPHGELRIEAPISADLSIASSAVQSGPDTPSTPRNDAPPGAAGKAPAAQAPNAANGSGAQAESVTEAIGAALRARLRAVTAAPFAVLGALSGHDAAAVHSVEFETGKAEPSSSGTETLKALAAALSERPGLALYAAGGFDPDADRRALAAQEIDLHVALATAGAALNVQPEPVDFSSPRDQEVLEEFAGQRLSAEQRATIASEADLGADGKPAAKHSIAYYQAIYDALVANAEINQEALARLGRYRAQSVADALAKLGIPAARIETGSGDGVLQSDDDGVAVPLEVRTLD